MDFDLSSPAYATVTLPALGIGTMAVLLLVLLPSFAVLGFLSGKASRRRRLAQGRDVDLRAGETSLGAIMALLGLLLAFSFGSAVALLEARKSDGIREANALGTAFLRADYLPEPHRTELKEALFAYAQTRLLPETGALSSPEAFAAFLDRSLSAQARLWPLTLEGTAEPLPPPIATFVAGSINEVLDAHQHRMRSLSVPVAELSQTIVVITALAALFLLGNRSGLADRPLTWRTFVFSALLFAVMMTVIDVQRSAQGLIRVDQSAMRATLVEMAAALP